MLSVLIKTDKLRSFSFRYLFSIGKTIICMMPHKIFNFYTVINSNSQCMSVFGYYVSGMHLPRPNG